ncbi:hypothetical protein [Carnobacterium sp. ISL-102]|uniref:hypothetical protein n=1 Tax=Carnobacterium sp. ISL-102 TaxID=2819142 RepID=UPI001BEB3E3D|nr:hypothetical protein [Carnobacterium sp. ISL-102]MBT2732118.1 hypothetical protein [Carnobacterium sp. ISL-102]
MLAEARAYRFLVDNEELNLAMDEIRGKKIDSTNVIKQGIFTYTIPDIFIKKEVAPFIRINPIDEDPALFMDDENIAENQTIQIDFWCKSASDSLKIKRLIDRIMKGNNHSHYDSDRYKDPDIDLIMNVRKYRVFNFDLEN